jgi:hypothetical protein|nr:MAG TPA: hypothetical protein [Caudoviricetes sp.]
MDLEKVYPEEIKILNDIYRRNDNLVEEDIAGAFKLQKDAIQAYHRWSNIKYYTKKDLKRGQGVALKERLEEICSYLKYIHTSAKSTWLKAREDLRCS